MRIDTCCSVLSNSLKLVFFSPLSLLVFTVFQVGATSAYLSSVGEVVIATGYNLIFEISPQEAFLKLLGLKSSIQHLKAV